MFTELLCLQANKHTNSKYKVKIKKIIMYLYFCRAKEPWNSGQVMGHDKY